MNLQDAFLNQVRTQKIPVTVFMMEGHPIRGEVRGFDPFCVLIHTDGKLSLLYKHAISSIVPVKPVSIFKNGDPEGSQHEQQTL